MKKPRQKRIVLSIGSLWPQPRKSPRQRYRFSYPNPEKSPKTKTVILSTDLETSIEMAQQIINRLQRKRSGLAGAEDQRYADQAAIKLAVHLDDWENDLRARGRDAKHVRQMAAYARAVLLGTPPVSGIPENRKKRGRQAVELADLGFRFISDIILSRVRKQIGLVKAKRSAATANRYRDAAHEFLQWGIDDSRWPANPLKHLERFNVAGGRVVVRRALPAEQFAALIDETEKGGVYGKLTGAQRSLVYRACVAAGLRANEARQVAIKDAVLKGPHPGIWIAAEISKNGKRQFVPLPSTLAAELLAGCEGRGPEEPLLGKLPGDGNTSRMIKHDLAKAGIPYKTAEGVFDFHALRHECGALLISAGANIKAVQQHLRHSSIQLTLDTYGHLLPDDREHARRSLLSFDKGERKTLTDNAQRNAQRETDPICNRMKSDDTAGEARKELDMGNPAKNADSANWSHGESNPDLLNAIQPSGPQNPHADQNLHQAHPQPKAQSAARKLPNRSRGLQPQRRGRPALPGRTSISISSRSGIGKGEVLNTLERLLTRPVPQQPKS